jgi:hypothetical protein
MLKKITMCILNIYNLACLEIEIEIEMEPKTEM